MIDKAWLHPSQPGYIISEDGYDKSVPENDPRFAEVEAYLASHPEALVDEPVPPPPSAEELARQEEQTLLGYLTSTDWYVARWGETQVAIPAEVTQRRIDARDRISEIRAAR